MAEKPGLFPYIAPWLALAWVADLGGWPNLAQAIVGLIGLGLLLRLAKDWPLFAALSAPAVAFYSWSATGHAKTAFGHANPLIFVILILAMGVGFSMVVSTLGRALTGVLDTIKRRTWAREPWLRQAALGVAACVLAVSAHMHLKERREQLKAAEVAARDAEGAAASRAAAAKKATAEARALPEADALRTENDPLVPGVSCRYSPVHDSFVFKNQLIDPESGIGGKVDHEYVRKSYGPLHPQQEARVLDANVDLIALRQHATKAPILGLPSGDVVFMSPTDARLLMLNKDGRVLHLASFHETLLKYAPVACAGENGTRWAVALGPVAKVFERLASETLPFEVLQDNLNSAWFP